MSLHIGNSVTGRCVFIIFVVHYNSYKFILSLRASLGESLFYYIYDLYDASLCATLKVFTVTSIRKTFYFLHILGLKLYTVQCPVINCKL